MSTNPLGVPYSEALVTARRAAAGVLRRPQLHAVHVEFGPRREVTGLTCWFHADRRTWFGRREVRACWVSVSASGPRVGPTNDVAALARRGLLKPPLEDGALRLEPAQVMERLASGSDGARWKEASVQLTLTTHEGQAVWWAIEESTDADVRTTLLAARDGSVVHRKVDVAHDAPATAAPPLPPELAREVASRLAVLRSGADRDEVYTAMHALQRIGPPVVPELLRMVVDEGEGIGARLRALDVLADLRARSVVPTLIEALGRAPPLLRAHIAGALGRIGDASARATLLQLAVHDDGEVEVSPGFSIRVRDEAAKALEVLERSLE